MRDTLTHLVDAQAGYLSLLSARPGSKTEDTSTLAGLEESAARSGAGLLAMAQRDDGGVPEGRIRTTDGYRVDLWVVMVQVVNHANDHRRQIAQAMKALGVSPPKVDAWSYGEATDAVTKIQD